MSGLSEEERDKLEQLAEMDHLRSSKWAKKFLEADDRRKAKE